MGKGHDGNLTEEEASIREQQVKEVSYNLWLRIPRESATYSGRAEISFTWTNNHKQQPLFLDFSSSGPIASLVINNHPVQGPITTTEGRLTLPTDHLTSTTPNRVIVEYTNQFDHDGEGLHQFRDSVDNEEYFYTQNEPFACHRFLPCFDQPSLRASLTLSVLAPIRWEVIANSPLFKMQFNVDYPHESLRVFEPTPSICTYLYAVIVGPYVRHTALYNNNNSKRNVEVSLWARKSLEKQLREDQDELMKITMRGLEFYESFFGSDYPFAKYAEIFVPEYNMGAMENPGAITFTERYLFKDPPTMQQRARRAETVLHEMAHMWFGDLVSPKWWSALWLNESFATFMAGLAKEDSMYSEYAWIDFNAGYKVWARREDQQSTTHSIHSHCTDTDSALSNFDGITYGKGAATLKQLVYLIGLDTFKAGLRVYFDKFKWGNTSIEDFLDCMHLPAGWTEMWLQTPGINTLTPSDTWKDGATTLTITQTAPADHPTLRLHKINIGVYRMGVNGVELMRTVKAEVKPQSETVIPDVFVAGETPKPDFVFVNNGDYAYCKARLDAQSLQFALSHLSEFGDLLQRQLLWVELYDLVRDGLMSAERFVDAAVRNLQRERFPRIVSSVLMNVSACVRSFTLESSIPLQNKRLHDIAVKLLLENKDRSTVSDIELNWARTVNSWSAMNKQTTEELFDLVFHNTPKWVDQGIRWGVLASACSWDLPEAASQLKIERERDNSDTGLRGALTCDASFPNSETKERLWRQFVDQAAHPQQSLHNSRASMGGFRWWGQRKATKKYELEFFEVVRTVFNVASREYAESFFAYLYPFFPEDDKLLEVTEALLKSLDQEKEKLLTRNVKEMIDSVVRVRQARFAFK